MAAEHKLYEQYPPEEIKQLRQYLADKKPLISGEEDAQIIEDIKAFLNGLKPQIAIPNAERYDTPYYARNRALMNWILFLLLHPEIKENIDKKPEPEKAFEEAFYNYVQAIISIYEIGEQQEEERKRIIHADEIGVAILTGEFRNALKPFEHEKGYITKYSADAYQTIEDENGIPHLFLIENAKEAPPEYDETLLNILFDAALSALQSGKYDGDTFEISYPEFIKEIGRRTRDEGRKDKDGSSRPNLFEEIDKIGKIVLRNIPGISGERKAFTYAGYDADKNTLIFNSPAFFALAKVVLTEKRSVTGGKGGNTILAEVPSYDDILVKKDIMTAKNKRTVSVIYTLIAGLRARGIKPDAKQKKGRKYNDEAQITYKVAFRTLLENSKETHGKTFQTSEIQRIFCGKPDIWKGDTITEKSDAILIEYLKKHTRVFDYFKDLKIKFKSPTAKTLDDVITITHHGINGDFELK